LALAALAIDMVYLVRLLTHLGVEFDCMAEAAISDPEAHAFINRVSSMIAGQPEAETDSKSAYDLCHRRSAGASTRHVERRVFKMRELVAQQMISLKLVRTHEMHADMMTKLLDLPTFRRCRSAVMNLEAIGNI